MLGELVGSGDSQWVHRGVRGGLSGQVGRNQRAKNIPVRVRVMGIAQPWG